MSVIENRRDMANQAAHEQRFFIDGARRLIRNGMDTLLLAGEPVTIDGLMRLFSSTPYPHPQTGAPVWPQLPADDDLARTLATAIFRERHGLTIDALTEARPEALQSYFLREFARPGTDRQSSGILSTFTGMADPFLSGPVKELFCTTTNFLPAEFSRKGAIIILDLPLDEYEEIGRTAALTLKYIWQRGIVRRQGLRQPGDIPVFLWADESQNFITPADPKFMNECRSSVCANVYLTQNINNYMAGFHQNAEAQANALLAGMNTKIAHRNGDHRTNEWFAETCARGRVMFYSGGTSESRGMSQNHSTGGGSSGTSSPDGGSTTVSRERGSSSGYSRERSTNEGWAEQMEFQVQPEVFTRMKSGGPRHDNEVQAVVFKSGEEFPPYGKPFTPVVFRQS